MTDDTIALRALLEKGSDATMLREMIGFAAQRLMELETDALCGAGHHERSDSRTNQRTGSGRGISVTGVAGFSMSPPDGFLISFDTLSCGGSRTPSTSGAARRWRGW